MPYKKPPKDKQFSSENQPKNRKSRKGIPNVSTRLKELLEAKSKGKGYGHPLAERWIQIALTDPEKLKENLHLIVETKDVLKALQQIAEIVDGKPTEKIKNEHKLRFSSIKVEYYNGDTKRPVDIKGDPIVKRDSKTKKRREENNNS